MPRRKEADTAQIKLRLPLRVKERLEDEAKKEYRSLNGEIVRRLEKSLGVEWRDLQDEQFLARTTQEPKRERTRDLLAPRVAPSRAKRRAVD
jgi:hypothetical protein